MSPRHGLIAITVSLVVSFLVLVLLLGANSALANYTPQPESADPNPTSTPEIRPNPWPNHNGLSQPRATTAPGGKLRHISTSPHLPNWMLASFEQPDAPRYSMDGGNTWFPVKTTPWTDLPYGDIDVVLVPKAELSTPPRFLAGVDSQPYQPQNGMYRCGDLGYHWARQTFNVGALGCNTRDMFFDGLFASPAAPEYVRANVHCYWESPGFPPADWMFFASYESNDHGVTWTGPTTLIYVRAVSPSNPLHLYGWRESKWYESWDGGKAWSSVTFSIPVTSLDVGPAELLYGLSYTRTITGASLDIGIRSSDGGKSWSYWDIPEDCRPGERLLAHPTIPNLLLMRCHWAPPTEVMRSLDGGDTWSQIDAPAGAYLTLDYGHPGRLLGVSDCEVSSASKCGGLWYSDDGGTTWAQLTSTFSEYPYPYRINIPMMYR